jgi:hypothetical protein
MNTITLKLTKDEAILVRDAMIEMKQLLKTAQSERGQRLHKQAAAIAQELAQRIL